MSAQSKAHPIHHVSFTVGHLTVANAPVATFNLLISLSNHKASGLVDIVHAVKHGNHQGVVHGKIYATKSGEGKHVISLKGLIEAPEAEIHREIPFEASFVVDDKWNGEGGFTYAHTHVEHAHVKGVISL